MSGVVLVTGGAGFIGSHTVDALLSRGYRVRILDSLVPAVHRNGEVPDYLPADAEFVLGDVRDLNVLRSALKDVEVIFHLAAVQDYHRDITSYFDVNVTGTASLYEAIREIRGGSARVIIGSTQFVQGEGLYRTEEGSVVPPSFRSITRLRRGEWDHLDPNGRRLTVVPTPANYAAPGNPYGVSKEGQERMARSLGDRYDIPTTIFRYSIVQGERQSLHNTYSGACRIFSLAYRSGAAPVLFEDGNQTRDFVNIHDVVDANMMAMETGWNDGETLSIGGGRATSILEFDRVVAREYGETELAPQTPGLFRIGDTRHAFSDVTPMLDRGWRPRRGIADSVSAYRDWLESHEGLEKVSDPSRVISELIARGTINSVEK